MSAGPPENGGSGAVAGDRCAHGLQGYLQPIGTLFDGDTTGFVKTERENQTRRSGADGRNVTLLR
jgi:hypothetical protein